MEKGLEPVVVIAYYWPPAGGPGVQRWLGFTRYFTENGFNPIVIVPENPFYPQVDTSLSDTAIKELEVIRVPIIEPLRWARRLGFSNTKEYAKGLLPDRPKGWIQKLLFSIRGSLFVPDSRVFWVKPVTRVVRRLIAERSIRLLITTGPPHSVHLTGLKLTSQLSNLKWIADFRDPWTDIGYHQLLPMSALAKKRHQHLEAQVLRRASLVLTTTQRLAYHFKSSYSISCESVTNGFSELNSKVDEATEEFILLHVGSLFAHRNPERLWHCIQTISMQEKYASSKMKLWFVGEVDERVKASLRAHDLEDQCSFFGYVPKDKLHEYTSKASLLLLVEGESEAYDYVIPGKLFEYLSIQAPLMIIGPEGWEVTEMVKDYPMILSLSHHEEAPIIPFIERCRSAFNQDQKPPRLQRDVAKFQHKELTKALATYIRSL